MFSHKWLEKADLATQDLIISSLKPVNCHKGGYVHRAGDMADGLYYIERGVIRINKLSNEGKELLVRDLLQGEWFGFIGYFGIGRRPNDAIVLHDSKILHLPSDNLAHVIEQCPAVSLGIAHVLATYVEEYYTTYENSVFMPLNRRIEATLQQLCEWQGSTHLEISQNELAAILGVTKEAIGINLNMLKSQGLVELGYRKIEYKG